MAVPVICQSTSELQAGLEDSFNRNDALWTARPHQLPFAIAKLQVPLICWRRGEYTSDQINTKKLTCPIWRLSRMVSHKLFSALPLDLNFPFEQHASQAASAD